MSFFSFFALANASGPQGYQSTGLWACCSRYGLLSLASRLAFFFSPGLSLPLAFGFSAAADRSRAERHRHPAPSAPRRVVDRDRCWFISGPLVFRAGPRRPARRLFYRRGATKKRAGLA